MIATFKIQTMYLIFNFNISVFNKNIDIQECDLEEIVHINFNLQKLFKKDKYVLKFCNSMLQIIEIVQIYQ